MRTTFDQFALQWIEAQEGYMSDLKGDAGGLTIFGIASRWHGAEVARMRAVSKESAREIAAAIYLADYWNKYALDAQPWPMDMVLFDTVVQHGPRTVAALTAPDDTLAPRRLPPWEAILLRRLVHYQTATNRLWQQRTGWINRIADLYTFIAARRGGQS